MALLECAALAAMPNRAVRAVLVLAAARELTGSPLGPSAASGSMLAFFCVVGRGITSSEVPDEELYKP
jgi:hypothetical protein